MKNHEIRPTSSIPIPEVNATIINSNNHRRGCGCGRGRAYGRGTYVPYSNQQKNENNNKKGKDITSTKHEKICYRCGMEGRWSRICHMTKHLVEFYQA